MGLDISKIQNAELQKLAYKADNDNNGFLDAEEVSIFKEEALAKEGVSAEDFNQAMGLYKSVAATETEAKTVTKTEATAEETKVKSTAPKEETNATGNHTVKNIAIDIVAVAAPVADVIFNHGKCIKKFLGKTEATTKNGAESAKPEPKTQP